MSYINVSLSKKTIKNAKSIFIILQCFVKKGNIKINSTNIIIGSCYIRMRLTIKPMINL